MNELMAQILKNIQLEQFREVMIASDTAYEESEIVSIITRKVRAENVMIEFIYRDGPHMLTGKAYLSIVNNEIAVEF